MYLNLYIYVYKFSYENLYVDINSLGTVDAYGST